MFTKLKTKFALASIAVAMVAVIACGTEDQAPASVATASPVSGVPAPVTREVVDAPIDNTELQMRESFPVQYAVYVQSGLPNACYAFNQIVVDRNGDTIDLAVTNTGPAPSGEPIACAEIYGMVENTVNLPGTYDLGTTYTVNVNGTVLTFEGQDPITTTQTGDRSSLTSADELSDLFQGLDAAASRGDEAFQPFFGVSGEAMTLFGERVEVYVFDSLEDAESAAAGINEDGSIVGSDGQVMFIKWIATPHFYAKEDSVILYVGENDEVIKFLDSIAGGRALGSRSGEVDVVSEPLPIAVGEKYPEDLQNVLRGLERRFGELGQNGVLEDSIFGVVARLVLAGDEEVQLFVFDEAGFAKEAAGRISPDGGTITSADGQTVSSVRWIGPAHFYLRGDLITLYVGDSIEITEVLDAVAGEKFAGPRVVIEEPDDRIDPPMDQGFKLEAAPVELVEVMILESFPPQYVVNVTIGLPSGCHEFNSFQVKRDERIVSIQILNQTPAEPSICTLIYGLHELSVPLEGPFEAGVEFDVLVNGESQGTFVGQG
ncbi:MAG: hypothetical protein HQ478_10875 [Chloroflexi bacterium]|nr:hypothetical protein [Chloroflexota bacterium]